MKTRKIFIVDAFTDTPLSGNPCAVVTGADGLSDAEMLKITQEMNLSETSFVLKSQKADLKVRYFTPRAEINFAGHPTIATTYLLAAIGQIPLKESTTKINIEFNIGVLPIEILSKDGKPESITMSLATPFYGETVSKAKIAASFNDLPIDSLPDEMESQVVGAGTNFLIVPVKDKGTLFQASAKSAELSDLLQPLKVSAAYLFSLLKESDDIGFIGRLIDPKNKFEDPFTGSAAGAVGAYLGKYKQLSNVNITVFQGENVGRPGKGILELSSSGNNGLSLKLNGKAVKVLEGEITF